jgi:alkyldihydroxyacetonephosphate synthase
MKLWNGWGEENTDYPLPGNAEEYLTDFLGDFQDLPDATRADTIISVPESRLKHKDFISLDPLDRFDHSHGQSLPDWIYMRSGQIPNITDGVTYPRTDQDIKKIFDFARENQVTLIPYGGGTSVVGHVNPPKMDNPVLTVDLSGLNQILKIDKSSQTATIQAGMRGPDIEIELNKRGFTLGHFPQSFEYSTVGGWIASRSCGQQSYYYGRIEDLFRGGYILTPRGDMRLQPFPATAAGPDLRQLILGSEGRFGIVTCADLQIRPIPQFEEFYGIIFKTWDDGVAAVRQIAQNRIQVSMLRLSDANETETTFVLSGRETLVRMATMGLSKLGYGRHMCLLILGVTGDKTATTQARKSAIQICRQHGGIFTSNMIGKAWAKSRFLTPYLRNTLWDAGIALDTLETAVPWSQVSSTKKSIINSITETARIRQLRLLVFGHLSHVYQTGASIYITYLFRRSPIPGENLEHWRAVKKAASQAILDQNGTISHQHGVGSDHADYLGNEIGELGINFLTDAVKYFDPNGLMNSRALINTQGPKSPDITDL